MKYSIPCLATTILLAAGCGPEAPVPEAGMPATAGSAEHSPAAEPGPEELSEFDVLGLRAGMSEGQVRATLDAIGPQMRIDQALTERYSYTDGTFEQHTDEHLDRIVASSGDPDRGTALVIHFSPPPGPPRLVSLAHTEAAREGIAHREIINRLMLQYGTPVFQFESTRQTVIGWSQPGRPQCAWDNQEDADAWTVAEFRQLVERRIRRIELPDDPVRCGVSVVAQIPLLPDEDERVPGYTVFLVDVGASARSAAALAQWLDELAGEAREAR